MSYGPERLQANTHYYKSTDLDYKTLSKDYKNGHKPQIGLQHLNKLYIDMETLRMVQRVPWTRKTSGQHTFTTIHDLDYKTLSKDYKKRS